MSAGREAHDAHVVGIDAKFGGMRLKVTDAVIDIVLWNLVMAIRHAIGQHHEVDAQFVEIGSPARAFVDKRQMAVAATRQADHGARCRLVLVGTVDVHVGLSGPSFGGSWRVVFVSVQFRIVAFRIYPHFFVVLCLHM